MTNGRHTRREFLGIAGAGVAGVATGASFDSAAVGQSSDATKDPQSADLVVYNAKVYTMEDSEPTAEAFAIKNGRFVLVGSNESAKLLTGKGTQTLDAKQMTIVPGFI